MKPPAHRHYFSRHPVLRTRDLDEARYRVAQKFCDHRLDLHGQAAGLSVTHNALSGQDISVNYLSYGAEVSVDPGLFEAFYMFQIPLLGQAEILHRGDELVSRPGLGAVLNPDRASRLRWGAGCAKLLFQINRAHITSVAESLTRTTLPGPVRFDTQVDFATPNGAELYRIFSACAVAADRDGLFDGALTPRDLRIEQDLAHALLSLQPSNISHILAKSDRGATTREIRRALEFIHGNLAEQITIADIATAAGVTPRTLQKAFRRDFSKTPMQVLRDARLDAAHYLLSARQSTPSVSDAAFGCGFSHLGRFSAQYRQRFGHAPSAQPRPS